MAGRKPRISPDAYGVLFGKHLPPAFRVLYISGFDGWFWWPLCKFVTVPLPCGNLHWIYRESVSYRFVRKVWAHGPLTRYVKLRIVHAPGMPGTFSPPPRVNDPDMHHGTCVTCVTHVPWCMPGSLTRSGNGNVSGIPGTCPTSKLRIWQEAHEDKLIQCQYYSRAVSFGGENVPGIRGACATRNFTCLVRGPCIDMAQVNSLAPRKIEWNFRAIFKLNS